MSNVICTDDRFEVIAKYKAKLLEKTNIETSADEMAVIDNILFRMWQIGWLDRLEQPTVDAVPVVRCGECKYKPHWDEGANEKDRNGFDVIFPDFTEGNRCPCQCSEDRWYSWIPNDDWFCADGERKDGESDV